MSWPDHGTPDLSEEFDALVYLLNLMKKKLNTYSKIVTHCSAGIGRTGSIISMFNITQALQNNVRAFTIFGTVRRMRE
jgi:protein tyrosine phosphatase